MKLPLDLKHKKEWILIGPMGPQIPEYFFNLASLCVDGGANFTNKADIWIGDRDSYKGIIPSQNIFEFSPQKDKSDLSLALKLIGSESPSLLHFWGFLGGRKDHELFNLGEALAFLDGPRETQIIFYDQLGRVTFHLIPQGKWTFKHNGTFSIGCIKEIKFKISGNCDYSVTSLVPLLPLSSVGLSNIAKGEFEIETTGPLFLYFSEEL